MSVTVIIPSTLRRPGLNLTIDSVLRSASSLGKGAELILVVNGHGGGQPVPISGSPFLRVIQTDRASAPAARNAGINAARNNAVVFTDDDCCVPEVWCAEMDMALNQLGKPAVAGPVRIPVNGPISAFFDHMKVFDAPAINLQEVRYLVGANCGLRRDLLPPNLRFDDLNFNNAAEDADLGYRLRDGGAKLFWMNAAPPVEHIIEEEISEITDRFMRYGRGSARLYLISGRWREAVPGAHAWYDDMVTGHHSEYRRFFEIAAPEMRSVFAVYNLLLISSFLIGYLEEMATELQYPLINVDIEQLTIAYQKIGAQLACSVMKLTAGDWRRIAVDFSRLKVFQRNNDQEIRTVAQLLKRCAPPTAHMPPEVHAQLIAYTDDFAQLTDGVNARVQRAWDAIASKSGPITGSDLNWVIRSVGGSFCDGCHEVEKLMHFRNCRQM